MTRQPDEHLVVGVPIGVVEDGVEPLMFISGDDSMLLLTLEKADWLAKEIDKRLMELRYER